MGALSSITSTLLLPLAAVVAIIGFLVLRRFPRTAFVLWAVVLCFVPYWLGLNLVFYAPPTSVIALLVCASLATSRRTTPGAVDWLVIVLIVVYLLATIAGLATIASGFVLVAHWGLGYLLGRMVLGRLSLHFVYGVLAICFTGVAILALIEFATHFNFFVLIKANNALYESWGTLRVRGGLPRAEGAFGSSIALGASLALGIPLAIASPLRPWIRGVMVLLMLGASVVTFSRIGMICSVLSLLLCLVFLRDTFSARARTAMILGTMVVAIAVTPLVVSTFSDAGDEASGSAGYRGDLLSLVPTMSLIGLSSSAYRGSSGTVSYGNFQSIDSALIFLGLNHGLIPLAIVLVILVAAIWFVVSGRATAPTIAIVAQIPAIATVALITQYANFFWFMCGLAVSSQLVRSRTASEVPPSTVWRRAHAPDSARSTAQASP